MSIYRNRLYFDVATDTVVADANLTCTKTFSPSNFTFGAITTTGAVNLGDGKVTQLTSNTTAVTLNTASGVITMFGVMTAGALAKFQVHNSLVTANSVVLASVAQAATSIDTGVQPVTVVVLGVSSGTFYLDVFNGEVVTLPMLFS